MASATYEVHLEMFEGPLDLLLFLIKKNDLDVLNVPISQITSEYLQYLDLMKELNLEVAGDFLVMASTLIQIKARSLLPAPPAGEDAEGPDPRSELVQKLLEYQKFKEAAGYLSVRAGEFADVFYRGEPHFEEHEKSLDIRIFDLLATLREVVDRAEDAGRLISGEEFPIEEKMRAILALLERKPYLLMRELFAAERKKLGMLGVFLALLELIKTQRVLARQEAPYAEILIYKKELPPEPAEQVWPAGEGGSAGPGPAPEAGSGGSAPQEA